MMSWRLRRKARRGIWDDRFLNGRPGNISPACRRFIMRAVAGKLVVTSTTGGAHSLTSYHYLGRAVDVGGRGPFGVRRMRRFQRQEFLERRRRYNELIGPINSMQVKNGVAYSLREGDSLEQMHDNHVHAAPRW